MEECSMITVVLETRQSTIINDLVSFQYHPISRARIPTDKLPGGTSSTTITAVAIPPVPDNASYAHPNRFEQALEIANTTNPRHPHSEPSAPPFDAPPSPTAAEAVIARSSVQAA